jgi:hypothetical protein
VLAWRGGTAHAQALLLARKMIANTFSLAPGLGAEDDHDLAIKGVVAVAPTAGPVRDVGDAFADDATQLGVLQGEAVQRESQRGPFVLVPIFGCHSARLAHDATSPTGQHDHVTSEANAPHLILRDPDS